MRSSYYCVILLFIISVFWLIEHTQANFNMLMSKKYDHHFFDVYYTAFEKHRNEVNKNQFWEPELVKYAKKMDTGGIVKRWADYEGWEDERYKYLRQHFLFTVRIINDSSDPAPLLILIHMKYQAFIHAIAYMNGALLLPEKDNRRTYCRAIATDLLSFSDAGTMGVIKKLEVVLKLKCGQTNKCTTKIIATLRIWAVAMYTLWNRFVPQMVSDDSSKYLPNDMAHLYEQLCNDQNEIMLQTKIVMMSLFEGIKQSVDKPQLPPMERLTLHFAAAINLWDRSSVTWAENFQILEDKYQIKEMMMQDDKTEMTFYGELRDNNKQEIEFDELKDLRVFTFHEETGIIELLKPLKEIDVNEKGKMNEKEIEIIDLENPDQDKLSRKRKGKEVIEE